MGNFQDEKPAEKSVDINRFELANAKHEVYYFIRQDCRRCAYFRAELFWKAHVDRISGSGWGNRLGCIGQGVFLKHGHEG